MGFVRYIGVTILLAGIVGCGSKSDSYKISASGVPYYEYATAAQAKNEYDTWQVKCLSSEKCPDSVGQLLVLKDRFVSICTATLIGEDTILTNSHCFDLWGANNRLVPEQEICDWGASIVFATDSPSGRQQVKCKKVLVKSFIARGLLYSDYMILQLDKKVTRKFDPVVRLGLEDKTKYTIRKVNPKSRGFGELEVQNCEVMYKTAVIPGAKDKDFYLHVAKTCEAIPGNSGSSLVDESGQVRAILFSGVQGMDTSSVSGFNKKLYLKARELHVSIMTNATCMEFDFPNTEPIQQAKCLEDRDNLGKVSDLVDRTEPRRKFKTQAELVSFELPEKLGYKLISSYSSLMAYYAPYCLKTGFVEPSEIRFRNQVLSAPIYTWTAEYVVNDRLKPVLEINTTIEECDVQWSPRQLLTTQATNVVFKDSVCFDSKGNRGVQKDTWRACEP